MTDRHDDVPINGPTNRQTDRPGHREVTLPIIIVDDYDQYYIQEVLLNVDYIF